MDLLYSKYASPFILLDEMIHQGRLLEFVNTINDIEDEKKLWSIWLLRVYDKSYDDWITNLHSQAEQPSEPEIEATVKDSYNILSGFNPAEENHGII